MSWLHLVKDSFATNARSANIKTYLILKWLRSLVASFFAKPDRRPADIAGEYMQNDYQYQLRYAIRCVSSRSRLIMTLALLLLSSIQTNVIASSPIRDETKQERQDQYCMIAQDRRGVTFDDSMRSREDWAGIVFGAKVTAEAEIRPVEAEFLNDKESTIGSVKVKSASGRSWLIDTISRDHWTTAQALASYNCEMLETCSGDAVGIVELTARVFIPQCSNDNTTSSYHVWAKVALHPLLLNTRIGESALYVEAYPQMKEKLLDDYKSNFMRKEIENWLGLVDEGSWKIMDRPVSIQIDTADREKIDVRPANSENEKSFLQMKAYFDEYDDDENSKEKDFSDRFLRILPSLTAEIDHYREVNEFARTFSLVRWLWDNQAIVSDNITNYEAIESARTPAAIEITDKGFKESNISIRDDRVSRARSDLQEYMNESLSMLSDEIKNEFAEKNTEAIRSNVANLGKLHEKAKELQEFVDELEGKDQQTVIEALSRYLEINDEFVEALNENFWGFPVWPNIDRKAVEMLLKGDTQKKANEIIGSLSDNIKESQHSYESASEKAKELDDIFARCAPDYASWRACLAAIYSFETNEAINTLETLAEPLLRSVSRARSEPQQ